MCRAWGEGVRLVELDARHSGTRHDATRHSATRVRAPLGRLETQGQASMVPRRELLKLLEQPPHQRLYLEALPLALCGTTMQVCKRAIYLTV